MKVIIYNEYWKLNKCKKLIAIYENVNSTNNRAIIFIKNGFAHNKTSYAYININSSAKQFAHKDIYYEDITNTKSWRKFMKQITREENLKIFK